MQLTIRPADDETHRELAAWRYPPPYDFYDGDVDPVLNPERYFGAFDQQGELVGFYYFEPKPPDLDYGLGLRPDLVGQGLGLDFFLAAADGPLEITGPMAAKLFLSSSSEDADVFLVLRLFDPQDREILSHSKSMLVMRFVDADAQRRYGTFIYARCG